MALPTVVGVGTPNGAAGVNNAITWPAGHQAGDYALLAVETAGQAVTAPSGWTEISCSPQNTASSRLTVFEAYATSSSEANPSIADAGDHTYGVIIAFRGVHATTPFELCSGDTDAGDTNVNVPGAGPTTGADRLIVAIATNGTDTSGTGEWSGSWTNADLANVTHQFGANGIAGNGGGIGIATGEKASAGSYTTTDTTLTTSSAQGRISLALIPTGSAAVQQKLMMLGMGS